jgi:D-aspartate ligase
MNVIHTRPAARHRTLAPALLSTGNYLGTLAAARDLGRQHVEVVLAESSRGSICGQSWYVTRELRSPPPSDPRAWVDWMLAFGEHEPGHVLFATSDDVCWLLDWHRDEFARRFQLYQPAQESMYELLNKRRLYQHCRALGIDQPVQWTAAEALANPAQLTYPVLLKPRTQAGIRVNPKGLVCDRAEALAGALARAAASFSYGAPMLRYDPEVSEVMVQAFHDEAEQHVYSLAGFYAPERDVFLLRGSEKVLQHPLRVGVGLCFESRPVDMRLAAQLRELFDRVGYCGPFEVEYIRLGSGAGSGAARHLLIDVNARFYGQMGFEIARGLPIPRLCHAAATGDWKTVQALAAQSELVAHEPTKFRDAWMLRLYATTHMVSGNIGVRVWQSWLHWSQSGDAGDPVAAQDDRAPASRLRWQVGQNLVRHPRSTVRRFFVR